MGWPSLKRDNMTMTHLSNRFDHEQPEPRRRASLLARITMDAVVTKIVLVAHDINQAERNVVDIKPPTGDEGAHPSF